MSRLFDREKLEVYQAWSSFIAWLEPVLVVGLIKANSDYRLHESSSE